MRVVEELIESYLYLCFSRYHILAPRQDQADQDVQGWRGQSQRRCPGNIHIGGYSECLLFAGEAFAADEGSVRLSMISSTI